MSEFIVPALGYDFAAIEPHIDAKTMEIHHDKHHGAYVANLNAALKNYPEFFEKPIDEILKNLETVPEPARIAVRNNGGGHANHTLFWEIMKPGGSKEPTGKLADAINSTFGGLDALKEKINDAGLKRFGSGWAWLVENHAGGLSIMSTPNQDSPLIEGLYPVLGVDVWEHAYYLHYQNRRGDYLKAWWNVVNWDVVGARFGAGK